MINLKQDEISAICHYYIIDCCSYHTGKGYGIEKEWEDGENKNNSGTFIMDTVWYTIDRFGKVTRRK